MIWVVSENDIPFAAFLDKEIMIRSMRITDNKFNIIFESDKLIKAIGYKKYLMFKIELQTKVDHL